MGEDKQNTILSSLHCSIKMDESQPSKDTEEADQAVEKGSRSGRSHRSARSSASAAATTARAKAAACEVKASYAEKEAIMMRERAQLEEHQQKTLAEITRRRAEVEAELCVETAEGSCSSIYRS